MSWGVPNNFNMNNFNDFLRNAQNTLLCGPECEKQKKAKELEDAYLNAETNKNMAEYNVNTTEKDYITFTKGTAGYDEVQTDKLTATAIQISNTFLDNFNNDVNKTKDNINKYSGLLTNYNNVYELYFKYTDENNQLQQQYESKNSDVATNDRKTYYENQQIDLLNFIYKYIILLIYVITVIVYFCSVFLYPSPFTFKRKIILLLFLIILPFISTWLLSMTVFIIYKIYEILPKNVYKRL